MSHQIITTIMGIDGFTHCFWKSVKLEWVHVVYLPHELKRHRFVTNDSVTNDSSTCSSPVVDIDANNIAFKDLDDPVSFVIDCVREGIKSDLEMNETLDGDSRHHSKRASCARKANKLRCSALAQTLKAQLSAEIQNNSDKTLSIRLKSD